MHLKRQQLNLQKSIVKTAIAFAYPSSACYGLLDWIGYGREEESDDGIRRAPQFSPGGFLRAGSDYVQVERRSVTFLDQTMSRGEVFGLKKYIKIIHCQILNILMKKKFGLMLDPNFAREAELLAP
jgi:hypothetical protein